MTLVPCDFCGEPAEPDLCGHGNWLCPEDLHRCSACMAEMADQETYDADRDEQRA